MIYYAQNLATDEVVPKSCYYYFFSLVCYHLRTNVDYAQEFFLSIRRDISNCAEGTLVEAIDGNQITKATYTILPPEGTGITQRKLYYLLLNTL